jgi:hypothetical protein
VDLFFVFNIETPFATPLAQSARDAQIATLRGAHPMKSISSAYNSRTSRKSISGVQRSHK